jgi:hypothetical protein
MALFAELAGVRVIDARVAVPTYGAWHADLTLDKEVTPAATGLRLVLADLEMTCALWRAAAPYQGRTRLRVIGGAAGWRKSVKTKAYYLPFGVKLSSILKDLASEVGESVSVANDTSVGTHYEREAAPASTHLNWLARDVGWYIDAAGVTQVAARVEASIASTFSLVAYDGARGVATIATEKPADFVPGRTLKHFTLAATLKIGGVVHVLSKGALRTEVLAA